MSQRIPMTPKGYAKVLAELNYHRQVLRPQVVRDIEEARAHGDLSENAEYDAAKDRQSHIEGRTIELESALSMAEVIDIHKVTPSDRVIFGTTVDVEDVDTVESFSYRIVGTEEADVKTGMISYVSPIARALLGRSVGDEVRFDTPKGQRSMLINAVHYR
jgi:transcription elongation factor GreA